ncbi:hypothetical protein [Pedobacter psychrophilus]|uniref:hypothetical protein n=1 Tax=Pedobacter psychrophilus TaxID=1826909 RepID=UPI0012FDA961|nr:hypothetical protein [Pedobacter psychrophilus]
MRLQILSFAYLLISCNSQVDDKRLNKIDATDSPTVLYTNNKSELLYSETESPEKLEHILANRRLKITLVKSYLNSYITHDYSHGTDKYRDVQFALIIKQNSQILLDTILRKEDFVRYVGKECVLKSTLDQYFYVIDNDFPNKIEFLGKLDTRSSKSVFFKHLFDLKNYKFEFVKLKGEDQMRIN